LIKINETADLELVIVLGRKSVNWDILIFEQVVLLRYEEM